MTSNSMRDSDAGGDEAYDDMMSDRAMFDPMFNESGEELMGELRVRLGQAAVCERRGEIELADAYGAVAGNKLARAYRIACNVLTMEGV